MLKAVSHASASGLVRHIHIDLNQTPYLNWSWQITHALAEANEQSRHGDDDPARLCIISSGGLFFWTSKVINYVWAGRQPVNSHWPNPCTRRSIMLTVESGNGWAGQWRYYKRNVRDDFKRLFGRDVRHVDVVATMTDTDDTESAAMACYGDIFFTAR